MNKQLFTLLIIGLPLQAEKLQPPVPQKNLTVVDYFRSPDFNISVPPSAHLKKEITDKTREQALKEAEQTSFAEKSEYRSRYWVAPTAGAALWAAHSLFTSDRSIDTGNIKLALFLGVTTVASVREYNRLCEVEPRYQKALQAIADQLFPELLEQNSLNNSLNCSIQQRLEKLQTFDRKIATAIYQYEGQVDALCQNIELNGCLDGFPLIKFTEKLSEIVKIFNDLTTIFEEILDHHDRLSAKQRDQIEECFNLVTIENELYKKALLGLKKEPAFKAELDKHKEHVALQARIESEKAAKKAAELQAYAAQQQAHAAHQQANAAYEQAALARQEWWNNFWDRHTGRR